MVRAPALHAGGRRFESCTAHHTDAPVQDPSCATEANNNMVRLLILTAMLAAVSLACSGEADKVTMGTDGAYPPYNFVNDDGEVDGFERELGDELCRRADLECTWVTNEWDTIIPNLVDGQYDTVMAGMSITDERDEVIDFTQPYIPPIPSVYIALAGSGDDAVNGSVGAEKATIHSDYLSESGATLIEFDLAEEVIQAVLDGETDAALVDRGFAHENMAAREGQMTVVGPNVDLDSGIGIGVREDDSELKDKLDEAIRSMKDDGSLNELIRKWFDGDADTF